MALVVGEGAGGIKLYFLNKLKHLIVIYLLIELNI